MPSTSMRLDNNCASVVEISFYLYNAFCFIVLPGLIYFLLSFVLYSIRPKLRNILSPSLPKQSISHNLAALVLTGLAFSLFVLVCDFFALFYSLSKHELKILDDYEDTAVQTYTIAAISIISALDFIFFVISLLSLGLLFCFQSERCNKKHLNHCLWLVCCVCICKLSKKRGYHLLQEEGGGGAQTEGGGGARRGGGGGARTGGGGGAQTGGGRGVRTGGGRGARTGGGVGARTGGARTGGGGGAQTGGGRGARTGGGGGRETGGGRGAQTEDSTEMLRLENRAKYLQRQEEWLLQKREEKRQSPPPKHWFKQWKNQLELQEDQLQQWNNNLRLQKCRLLDKKPADIKIKFWRKELDEWEEELQKWAEADQEANPDVTVDSVGNTTNKASTAECSTVLTVTAHVEPDGGDIAEHNSLGEDAAAAAATVNERRSEGQNSIPPAEPVDSVGITMDKASTAECSTVLTVTAHVEPDGGDIAEHNSLGEGAAAAAATVNERQKSIPLAEPKSNKSELWESQHKQHRDLVKRQYHLKQDQNRLRNLEDDLRVKLDKRLLAENKAWLLMLSFLAPLVCIGTHGGFVIMAWASDPAQASSLAVVYTLSFFYYYFGFRQLYIRMSISSFRCCKHKTEPVCDPSTELEEYHKNLREINLKVLCCELLAIPIFMGIQAIIVFSYFFLPGPISSVPLNVMNLVQLVLIFGTGLITYKLFTFHAPTEEIILDGFMREYNSRGSPLGDAARGIGQALANALRKYSGSARGEYYSDMHSDNSMEMESFA